MKAIRGLVVVASLVSAGHSLAQDPGFRVPSEGRSSQQTVATPAPATGTYAAGINDMDVLDNQRQIRPGDILGFRIVEDKVPASQLRVSVTGEIIAPHVGVFRAAGRTCRELAHSIKSQLEKTIYQRATVIVTIDVSEEERRGARYGTQGVETFTVFGQVLRQGKYELALDQDFTISQAVLMAGGFAQFANKKQVRLIRKTPQGSKTIFVNLESIMERGRLDQDLALRDGDVIIVKEIKINI